MYQIILLTWVSIFKQMSGDLSFEKKTQGSVLLLLCSGKCPHNRPSGHGYLLATDCKNHPIERLWISKQRLKAKCQNLITIDNRKNLMQRFMSDHRELFSLVWLITTHHFFLFVLLFVCCAIMFIFFLCKLELLWAWPSYTRIPTNQISYVLFRSLSIWDTCIMFM